MAFKRLKKFNKNKKIICAYDAKNFYEIQNYIKSNEIVFILPHQLKFIKKRLFDLTIALDCIHEIDSKTIKYYWNCINLASKNLFLKIWENTDVPYSFFHKLNIHNNSYMFKKNWKLIKKNQSIFPSSFYNLIFKIK